LRPFPELRAIVRVLDRATVEAAIDPDRQAVGIKVAHVQPRTSTGWI